MVTHAAQDSGRFETFPPSTELAGHMSRLPALRKFLSLMAFLAGAAFLLFAMQNAQAQRYKGEAAEQGPGTYSMQGGRGNGIGGYSLRLSDVWGPAKMPPAPKDFGPHFDFPPEPLNGAPLHDPYPN
jgi:hypothetical protein